MRHKSKVGRGSGALARVNVWIHVRVRVSNWQRSGCVDSADSFGAWCQDRKTVVFSCTKFVSELLVDRHLWLPDLFGFVRVGVPSEFSQHVGDKV